MFFFLFTLFFSTKLAAAPHEPKLQRYLERIPNRERGTIVVIITPGWQISAYEALLVQLWKSDFAVWTLSFPLATQSPKRMDDAIQKTLNQLDKYQPTVVAHGFAGSVVANMIAQKRLSPKRLVLLASPLHFRCSKALRSHLQLESSIEDPMPLLYGSFRPSSNISSLWVERLQNWCKTEHFIYTKAPNIWAAASGLDNIAPPESIRLQVPQAQFFRSGPLAFHLQEPNHPQMLVHKPTIKAAIQWIRQP